MNSSVLDKLRRMEISNNGTITLERVCGNVLPERVNPLGPPLVVDEIAVEEIIKGYLKDLPKANAFCLSDYTFHVIPHTFRFKSIQFYEVKI